MHESGDFATRCALTSPKIERDPGTFKRLGVLFHKGKHTFIDKVQVRYVSEDDKYWAELKNFGHKYVHIPEHFLREYDRLLMGGFGRNWILDIYMTKSRRASAAQSGSTA